MLEFIVLGLVPGTYIQLTFTDVVMLWVAVLLVGHSLFSIYHDLKLMQQYELNGTYFTLVARKHWLTRKLHS